MGNHRLQMKVVVLEAFDIGGVVEDGLGGGCDRDWKGVSAPLRVFPCNLVGGVEKVSGIHGGGFTSTQDRSVVSWGKEALSHCRVGGPAGIDWWLELPKYSVVWSVVLHVE